jgi:hypothetical protein
MKTRFLDTRNCHALLPQGHGLPLAQQLEACLQGINDKQGPLHGEIDRLIKHNQRTQSASHGSARFIDSPVEIAQASDVSSRVINTQAVTRPDKGPPKLHTILAYEDSMAWKTIVPLQFLLKGWGDANRDHQCYVHTISRNISQVKSLYDFRARAKADSDAYYYVGITGRNWLQRFSEHIGEMRRGSGRDFYVRWRESLGLRDVLFVSSLMDINMTYNDAMDWEEFNVDRVAYGPNGLNMIPGGFKGQRLLYKAKLIGRDNTSLEDRERAITKFVRQSSRKGIPNPFIAELWQHEEHYLKVNESHPKRLSAAQVRRIRAMAEDGASIAAIAEAVGALNQTQVKNIIAGRTYRRVH